MEESIRRAFGLSAPDLRTVPVLNLAFVGDSVYELILRTVFTEENHLRGAAMTKRMQQFVRAEAQAAIAEHLLPELSEEESGIFRRGKNAHPESIPKHAGAAVYLKATGFEALLGYLYLSGRTERVLELVKKGVAYAEECGKQSD